MTVYLRVWSACLVLVIEGGGSSDLLKMSRKKCGVYEDSHHGDRMGWRDVNSRIIASGDNSRPLVPAPARSTLRVGANIEVVVKHKIEYQLRVYVSFISLVSRIFWLIVLHT